LTNKTIYAIIKTEKEKERKKMYEFEFWCEAEQEIHIFYGYSLNDVLRRYPTVNWSELRYVSKEYID
jgi:hypothetical protein